MIDELVVDSSVAVKWVANEPFSTEARHILAGYQSGVLTLLAPDLITAEVGNILWKKHSFQGVGRVDVQQMLNAYRAIGLTVVSLDPLLDSAFQLAIAHGRTVYDMVYLALSIQRGCQFVTADDRLYNAVHATFPQIVRLADWP